MSDPNNPLNPATRPPLAVLGWFSKIDRKVWAGGVGGVLAALTMSACKAYLGFDLASFLQPFCDLIMPPTAEVMHPLSAIVVLTSAFTLMIGYIVPAAYSDIYKRINAQVAALAITDRKTPELQNLTLSRVATEVRKIETAQPEAAMKPPAPPQ